MTQSENVDDIVNSNDRPPSPTASLRSFASSVASVTSHVSRKRGNRKSMFSNLVNVDDLKAKTDARDDETGSISTSVSLSPELHHIPMAAAFRNNNQEAHDICEQLKSYDNLPCTEQEKWYQFMTFFKQFNISSNANYMVSMDDKFPGNFYVSEVGDINLFWEFYCERVFRRDEMTDAQNKYQNFNELRLCLGEMKTGDTHTQPLILDLDISFLCTVPVDANNNFVPLADRPPLEFPYTEDDIKLIRNDIMHVIFELFPINADKQFVANSTFDGGHEVKFDIRTFLLTLQRSQPYWKDDRVSCGLHFHFVYLWVRKEAYDMVCQKLRIKLASNPLFQRLRLNSANVVDNIWGKAWLLYGSSKPSPDKSDFFISPYKVVQMSVFNCNEFNLDDNADDHHMIRVGGNGVGGCRVVDESKMVLFEHLPSSSIVFDLLCEFPIIYHARLDLIRLDYFINNSSIYRFCSGDDEHGSSTSSSPSSSFGRSMDDSSSLRFETEHLLWFCMPRILSLLNHFRQTDMYANFAQTKMQNEVVDLNTIRSIELNKDKKNRRSISEKIDEAECLLTIISPSRADQYDTWRNIGLCLKTIVQQGSEAQDDEMFKVFVKFSKNTKFQDRYPMETRESDCKMQWDSYKPKENFVGEYLLRHWARQDNEEAYRSVYAAKYLFRATRRSISGTHHHIALWLFDEFGGIYRCVSIKKDDWYFFSQPKWRPCENGITLKSKVSKEFMDAVKKLQQHYKNKLTVLESSVASDIDKLSDSDEEQNFINSDVMVDSGEFARPKKRPKRQSRQHGDSDRNNDTPMLALQANDVNGAGGGADASQQSRKDRYETKIEGLRQLARSVCNSGFKSSVMSECREKFYQERFTDELEKDEKILGFENGVLDLHTDRNQAPIKFRAGCMDDMVSFSTRINFPQTPQSKADVKLMEDFFKRLFVEPEVRNYFFNVCASCLHARNYSKKIFCLQGCGNNGKSVVMQLLSMIFGDYFSTLPTSIITGKRTQSSSCTPELIKAMSTRVCVVNEPDHKDEINTGVLKEMTGNDRMYMRDMFSKPVEAYPYFKLFVVCNTLPKIPASEVAAWNRVRVIPFSSRFVAHNDPNINIPATAAEQARDRVFEMDNNMSETLEIIRIPFLVKLVDTYDGLVRRDELWSFKEPPQVISATNEYRKRNDKFGTFWNLYMVPKQNSIVQVEVLYSTAFCPYYQKTANSRFVPELNEFEKFIEAYHNKLLFYTSNGRIIKNMTIRSEDDVHIVRQELEQRLLRENEEDDNMIAQARKEDSGVNA